jgi:hypothetical protein
MKALLKYAFFLALALAIGFYIYGPLNLEDIAAVHVKPEAAVAPVAPGASPSIDEELDYMVARRLGSLGGWRAFLAAHGRGVYTQSARVEVERLLSAEKALAPAAAELSNGAPPDARAASAAVAPALPFRVTEAAALTPDEVCKRDGDRLARLRSSPSSDGAARLANELGCEKLRPQVLGMMESLGYAVPVVDTPNSASPDTKAVSEAVPPAPPSPGTEVAALTPDEVCKRDEDRLARLRSSPSGEEAARFASELGCEKLRPQLLGLTESFGHAAPTPAADVSNGASSDAKAASAARHPAPSIAGPDVAVLTPDETCKRDGDRLARLRSSPSGEEAQRFASELRCENLRPQLLRLMESLRVASPARLAPANSSPSGSSPPGTTLTGVCASQRAALDRLRNEPSAEAARLFWRDLECERLRPQVRLLMESLNLTPESLGETGRREGAAFDPPTPNGADPDACRRETAELNRIRATPDLRDAKRFASAVTCDALKPQAARLLESLTE